MRSPWDTGTPSGHTWDTQRDTGGQPQNTGQEEHLSLFFLPATRTHERNETISRLRDSVPLRSHLPTSDTLHMVDFGGGAAFSEMPYDGRKPYDLHVMLVGLDVNDENTLVLHVLDCRGYCENLTCSLKMVLNVKETHIYHQIFTGVAEMTMKVPEASRRCLFAYHQRAALHETL